MKEKRRKKCIEYKTRSVKGGLGRNGREKKNSVSTDRIDTILNSTPEKQRTLSPQLHFSDWIIKNVIVNWNTMLPFFTRYSPRFLYTLPKNIFHDNDISVGERNRGREPGAGGNRAREKMESFMKTFWLHNVVKTDVYVADSYVYIYTRLMTMRIGNFMNWNKCTFSHRKAFLFLFLSLSLLEISEKKREQKAKLKMSRITIRERIERKYVILACSCAQCQTT